MNKSNEIHELAAALCKAQSQMGGAVKDAANPFFKSKYADLGSVIKAIKQPFADNGLSYSQMPISNNDLVGVTTVLMHSSGQWLSSELLLKPAKSDPQAAGSAITYARRYALQAIAGIPAEDDDGNAASEHRANKQSKQKLDDIIPGAKSMGMGQLCNAVYTADESTRNAAWALMTPQQQAAYNEAIQSMNNQ